MCTVEKRKRAGWGGWGRWSGWGRSEIWEGLKEIKIGQMGLWGRAFQRGNSLSQGPPRGEHVEHVAHGSVEPGRVGGGRGVRIGGGAGVREVGAGRGGPLLAWWTAGLLWEWNESLCSQSRGLTWADFHFTASSAVLSLEYEGVRRSRKACWKGLW